MERGSYKEGDRNRNYVSISPGTAKAPETRWGRKRRPE